MADYERRTHPGQQVAFCRRVIPQSAIGVTLGEVLPGLYQALSAAGARIVGPPFARWAEWGDADCVMEAGLPIEAPVGDLAGCEYGRLPACEALFTIHAGHYDGLHEAWAAMREYIQATGMRPAEEPCWECYVTDPGKLPDPADWRTELWWPLA